MIYHWYTPFEDINLAQVISMNVNPTHAILSQPLERVYLTGTAEARCPCVSEKYFCGACKTDGSI